MSEELIQGADGALSNEDVEAPASPSTTAVIKYLNGGDIPLAKRIPSLDDLPSLDDEPKAPAEPAHVAAPAPEPKPEPKPEPEVLTLPVEEAKEVPSPEPDATVVAPVVPEAAAPASSAPKHGAHFASSSDGIDGLEVLGQDDSWAYDAVKGNYKSPGRRRAIIGGAVAALLVAAIYGGGAFYFGTHFLPNTTIEGRDVSLQTVSELEAALDHEIADYSMHVTGDGLDLTISAADVDLQVNSSRYVEEAKAQQSQWTWPLGLLQGSHELSVSEGATFNEQKLEEIVKAPVEAINANAEPPADATIAYSEDLGTFVVVDEVYGTEIDLERATDCVEEGLLSLTQEVTLDEEQLIQPQVKGDDEHLNQAVLDANDIVTLEIPLRMGGHEAYVIDHSLIVQWVTLDENLKATVDRNRVDAWTHGEMCLFTDTVGSERTYTRPDGRVVTVSGGTYGWITDSDATTQLIMDALEAHSSEPIEIPCKQEAAEYLGIGQADWGGTWIDVDLAEQHAYYYVDNEVVWQTEIVSGTPDGEHNTPSGVYYINDKSMNVTLVGFDEDKDGEPDYKTDVTYWMPFINVNVGLHDAWWRYEFGGTIYTWYGSHGCINLPSEKAQELYDMAPVGTVVITHW